MALDIQNQAEVLCPAEYYVLGIAPHMIEVGDPYAQSDDVVALLRKLRGRGTTVVVGNAYSNLNLALGDLEAAKLASRKLAEADRIRYEALQDILDEDEGGERVPVLIMSELVDQEEFDQVLSEVRGLCKNDDDFAERAYACTPRDFRARRLSNKSLAELKERARKEKEAEEASGKKPKSKARAYLAMIETRMEYVYEQLAYTALVGGRKVGHVQEQAYDRLTIDVMTRLGRDVTNLSFESIEVEKATGDIPYRTLRQNVETIRAGVLSGTHDLGVIGKSILGGLGDRLDPARHVLETPWGKTATVEAMIDHEAMYNALRQRVEDIDCLYDKMLLRADDEMRELISFRYARELIASLVNGPKRFYRFLMEGSGVWAVLKGEMTVEELAEKPQILPITCKRQKGESNEAYFLRFVKVLLFRNGPLFEGIYDAGIQSGLSERLAHLGGDCGEGKWDIDYRDFHNALLFRFVYPDLRDDDDKFRKDRWQLVLDYLELIRDTELENEYRRYMGMPLREGLEGGDREALAVLAASQLWGARMRAFLNNEEYREYMMP